MTKRPDLDLDSASLERAIAATRRHFDGRPEREALDVERKALDEARDALTEERILEHAWLAPRRFRPLLYLPLAALFIGSIAFAQELGTLIDGARVRFFDVVEQHELAEPVPRPQLRKGTLAASPPAAQVPAALPSGSPSPSVLPLPSAVRAAARVSVPVTAPRSVATLPSASPAERDPAEAAVDEFALYREAHQAHFVEHNYAVALTRWDRYLAAAHHGSLVPEARYNRALALYHLGRREEASAALRPFADGAYGRYRRDEASRLLESLAGPAR